jgi:protein SCO1/2
MGVKAQLKRVVGASLVMLLACSLAPRGLFAVDRPEEVLDSKVGIFTQLSGKVDLSRQFTDGEGATKTLKEFAVPGKPIIIAPVYYKCPRLCGLLLDGVYTLLNDIPLALSQDYSLLVVGFDPTETPQDARKVMDKFNSRLIGQATADRSAVRFLVGSDQNVTALMQELGFRYMRDGQDFAHSAALMILTPSGEISQYFTGIEFPAWDVRLSLIEASKGEIGSAIDHLLLYCFRFDPLQGRYTWAVVGLLRVGGVLTLLVLAAVIITAARKRKLKEGIPT